jgi:hypothetical protein
MDLHPLQPGKAGLTLPEPEFKKDSAQVTGKPCIACSIVPLRGKAF